MVELTFWLTCIVMEAEMNAKTSSQNKKQTFWLKSEKNFNESLEKSSNL